MCWRSRPCSKGADPLLLSAVILALRPADGAAPGETIHPTSVGIVLPKCISSVAVKLSVLDLKGEIVNQLQDGQFFGEVALLLSTARTADVRAKTLCDLFVLSQNDFKRYS